VPSAEEERDDRGVDPDRGDPPRIDRDRVARGTEMYHRVYGDDALTYPPGEADFFDLMMGHLFGEVWSGAALDIPTRRLLVMGVLAAQHHFDILQTQFTRALETGELVVEQVREIVVQLVPYVGYPSSGHLARAAEAAIAAHEARG
jgi:4-carboxymuconolactone decarboxylase